MQCTLKPKPTGIDMEMRDVVRENTAMEILRY